LLWGDADMYFIVNVVRWLYYYGGNYTMKTPVHIKIALVTILLVVAVWADDSIRRPAVTRSWEVGSTAFTLSDSGIADDTKNKNGVMGVSWAWLVLIILTATVIDIVRRGIRYNQKNMKINRP